MIEISTSATSTTVTIEGDLDLSTRPQFHAATAKLGAVRRPLLVIDASRITFLDSTGAAFLISLADATRKRGGAAVLRGADERVLFVLETCGALDFFRLDPEPGLQEGDGGTRLRG
ncbi:anti-sigma-factor antagonist [Beutenbergia cavernae DSM 12333]|uniref:Anti-sigma-factor antagonist n=1 Tax=Beutenbergia cavernae (strain ATCC BAA-8 / DSM 12333 / CCUG 43141 / JCM 11478 / NBRC 16432 / NCIMB 13614 / HKI 0122) TaxID=471853 RepID=C5C335_BEUC1|nr:STAS domain-containing protein [Beutenbergia cavernae]ACQ81879.1 anti-sigma-factor antagonist [Beutenbergia cavernae DSM 12333]